MNLDFNSKTNFNKSDQSPPPDHCQCLSAQKVAELLDVHPLTVHRMLKEGRLRGMKHGRFTRVFQWSLEEYLIKNTIEAKVQPAETAQRKNRFVRSTSHQVAMRDLERLGL